MILNVEDADFRDLLFDYRAAQPGIMHAHKQFVNAAFCCHSDPALPAPLGGAACSEADVDAYYYSAPQGWYAPRAPHCPPSIVVGCAAPGGAACAAARALAYAAAGLDAASGAVADCARGGRVLIRVDAAADAAAPAGGARLAVEWAGKRRPEELAIANPSE